MKKMHLEDALDDNPRTRNLLKLIEDDVSFVKDYISSLQSHLAKVLNAQSDLCNALGSLSCHLKSYQESGNFKKSSMVLPEALCRFASKIDELSSMYQISLSQDADGLSSLKKFISCDITELFVMKEIFNAARNDMNRVLGNHFKFSKKREKEKQAKELDDEMFIVRKRFHEAALKYYSSLNLMQLKKVSQTLEPLLTFMKSHVTLSELNSGFMESLLEEEFCSNMESTIHRASKEVLFDKLQSVEEVERLEKDAVPHYFVETPLDSTGYDLRQKAGYLNIRNKTGLLSWRWDLNYFFIQGGSLMFQGVDEMVGKSIADLGFETIAEPVDVDDRRFVFIINQPSLKRQIILQADSYHSRDVWMKTILNASKECSYQYNSSPTSLCKDGEKIGSDNIQFHEPIQFDIITPNNESREFSDTSLIDQNLFDGRTKTMADAILNEFSVEFLGSQQVMSDRGDKLLKETMRQILAARAVHSIFKAPNYKLVISQRSLTLLDAQMNIIKSGFKLENISFWGVHEDNKKLFSFISRTKNVNDEPSFMCHVFECTSGDEICDSLSNATQKAYEAFLTKDEPHIDKETV